MSFSIHCENSIITNFALEYICTPLCEIQQQLLLICAHHICQCKKYQCQNPCIPCNSCEIKMGSLLPKVKYEQVALFLSIKLIH